MILDWIVCFVCGGGSLYCILTMPKKMIMRKDSLAAQAYAVESKGYLKNEGEKEDGRS